MNLKLLKALTVLPLLDWFINLKYNPWEIPSRHRNVALVEHTVLYGLVGFVASFLFGLEYAVLLFTVLAFITIPVEILLALKGVKPWSFLKGKEKTYVYSLFSCMTINVFIYYLIGSMFAFILK